ncbi:hypothetical protein [Kutzneria buriramensis]|uniref:Uncharacterized protein n=1 Tax=Kutzneria buriramensis TaxID=1045776 RepID=A0A3E0GWD5_9PSEU|nr:hypothetical protein [Kutzneria buriramensis]REH31177.1 hypothetical protein BCF44_122200 [Kutzneria buriramensis]
MAQPTRSTLSLREIWFLLEPAVFVAIGCALVMWHDQLHALLANVPTPCWWAALLSAVLLDSRVRSLRAARRRGRPGPSTVPGPSTHDDPNSVER